MTIRWTLYTLRTIGLLQWIDFLLIRYGPLHMILKLRAKPLQFQAAQHPWTPWDPPVQSPTPAPQWPGGRAQNSHNSAYCHHPSPACVCTHLYDPRFPNPSNQVSAVVRTQGHHPASPNPSSSQFPMSSRAPVSQFSSALIVSPGSLQQDPNDPTYYHQQDIGSVGDFSFFNTTYPISFRSQGAPDSVGPAASRPLDVKKPRCPCKKDKKFLLAITCKSHGPLGP